MRRVSWASTRSWSRSRRFAAAARIAGSVISWKTIRRTGHLRLERVEQVPGDGLALAVGVRGEQQLVDALERVAQLGDLALLLRRHDVERLELVVDVHAETGPRLALVLGRDVRRAAREVADVADRRLDDVVAAEVGRDLLGLGRRLDDHQAARRAAGGGGRGRGGTSAAARLARRRGRLGVGLRARSGRHVVTTPSSAACGTSVFVSVAASIHGRGHSSRPARDVFPLSHSARRRSDGRERSRAVNRAWHPRLRPLVRSNTCGCRSEQLHRGAGSAGRR